MKTVLIRGAIPAVLVATLGVAVSGCATVTRSTSTDWTVSSLPEGSEVRISNGNYCAATPCTFHVPRKSHFIATLSTPGYKPSELEVKPEVKPIGAIAFLGNGLIGGLIGAAIDVGTGAPLDPSHNNETVKLKPYSAEDLVKLGVADDGCTRDKADYARQVGVPCDALSTRVVFVHNSVLTPASQLAATTSAQPTQAADAKSAEAQPAQTAASQPVDTQPLQAAAQPAQTPPAQASAPQPVAAASPQPTQTPDAKPVVTAAR
jgi:hypothetical protein